MEVEGLAGPCLLEYQLVEGNGKWMSWNASWFLAMFERFIYGEGCGGDVPCLADSQGAPLELAIMRLLTVNVVGHHLVTLLRICPLIPFFGTIYAALSFNEAYLVVQALSLISMAQRVAVSMANAHPKHWGTRWMKVVDNYWPRLVHVGLGDISNLLGQVFRSSCDLQRAREIKFYHIWTHADAFDKPVVDQVCGNPLALMSYRSTNSFEEWLKLFQRRVESRPRMMLVDRAIGRHPLDHDLPSRVATGYGVDSALLDLFWAPPSCQFWSRPRSGPCCAAMPHRVLGHFQVLEGCEEFCCKMAPGGLLWPVAVPCTISIALCHKTMARARGATGSSSVFTTAPPCKALLCTCFVRQRPALPARPARTTRAWWASTPSKAFQKHGGSSQSSPSALRARCRSTCRPMQKLWSVGTMRPCRAFCPPSVPRETLLSGFTWTAILSWDTMKFFPA
ncbi:Uncharacterized protein SCF082_LOCUS13130 [Durusdinium trenchii]|uniref:Uncharacterized protein n=1 Tax=Durusdinium trenchii TaxID=1381693 RepID=A0ABP0JPN1_9DINO